MPSSLRNSLAVNTAFNGCEYDEISDGNWGQYADIEIQLVNNYYPISSTKHIDILPTIHETQDMHNNDMNDDKNDDAVFIDIMTKKIHIIGFICILTIGNILLQ